MATVDDEFMKIIENFLQQMASVQCEVQTYIGWLRDATSEIQVAIKTAERDV